MSKTHSQPLSKETVHTIAIAIGVVLYVILIGAMLIPGLIELLKPIKANVGVDPIDKAMVNEAMKLIEP
jgi:membrane protein involved in colicin uptake